MDLKDNSTNDERKIIKAVEERQEKFHSLIRRKAGKEGSQIDEKGAIECKSYEDFAIYWARVAGDAQKQLKSGRKKGWRKWSKKYQGFAKGVDGFMQDFSPIVDIVTNSFPPYGGLAIGTISALFAVAKNKEAMEGHLSTAIAGVKDRLPGFQMYRGIYDEDTYLETDLRTKIVEVYAAFIDLSIDATEFYLEHGYYRWLLAFGSPNRFKGKADAVQNAVVKIKMRCEELLSENMDKVKKSNEELTKRVTGLQGQVSGLEGQVSNLQHQVSDLESRAKKLQLNNDDAHLAQLQKTLGLGQWSHEQQRTELDAYRKALESSLRDDDAAEILERMKGPRLQRFKQSSDYRGWQAPSFSNTLILVAKNNENASETRHCWASPVALSEIDHLEAHSASYAFYTLPVVGRVSLLQVIPAILLQLLKLKLDTLVPGTLLEDLYAKAREYENVSVPKQDFEDAKTESLDKVATSIINYFDVGETVYVIVDRADRCEEDHQLLLLQILTQLVEKAKCTIKVLVVANRSGWSVHRKAIAFKPNPRIAWIEVEQRMIDE